MYEGQRGTQLEQIKCSQIAIELQHACMHDTHRVALWIKQHALRLIPKPDYLQHIRNSAIKCSPANHDQGMGLQACNVAQHGLSLGTLRLTHEQDSSRLR